jgi:outer membrane protein assembly factor BamB
MSDRTVRLDRDGSGTVPGRPLRGVAATVAVLSTVLLLLPSAGSVARADVVRCGRLVSNAPDIASAFQMGVRRSASNTNSTMVPPLTQRWTVTMVGDISYPIVAQGKTAVTVTNPAHTTTRLFVLDNTTGRTVWSTLVKGDTAWSAPIYDKGCVAVLSSDGWLSEYTLDTGHKQFSILVPDLTPGTRCGAPVVRQLRIFVSCGDGTSGHMYLFNATNGHRVWEQPVAGGQSGTTLTHGRIFSSYACGEIYAFDWLDGTPLWHKGDGVACSGGRLVAFSDGLIYTRDPAATQPRGSIYIYDTGAFVAHFAAGSIPAISGNVAYTTMPTGTISKFNAKTGAFIKTLSPPAGETYTTPPLVENGNNLYVGGASGHVYVLNPVTGGVIWRGDAHAPISPPDEDSTAKPLAGLNLGENLLVVPAGNVLTAFAP